MRLALCIVSAILLAACGASGGGSSSPSVAGGPLELFAGMVSNDNSTSLVDGPGTVARFGKFLNLAADRAGNLNVADAWNHAIRKITPQGVVSTLLVHNVPGEDLSAIAVDPTGTMYFSVVSCPAPLDCHGAFYRVSSTLEAVPVVPVSSSDGSRLVIVNPRALAFDAAGNLYISDYDVVSTCAVRRLTPSGDLTLVASVCAPGPGLVVAADGTIYVASLYSVVRIANGVVSLWAGGYNGSRTSNDGLGPLARFGHMAGMTMDASGDLYIADSGFATLRKIDPNGNVTTIAGGDPNPAYAGLDPMQIVDLGGLGSFVPGHLPGVLDSPNSVAIVGSDLYFTMPHAIGVVHAAVP